MVILGFEEGKTIIAHFKKHLEKRLLLRDPAVLEGLSSRYPDAVHLYADLDSADLGRTESEGR